LQDFYLLENHARKLEKNLHDAHIAAYQYRATLAECETSLAASWETLNKERRDHLSCREALTLESQRYKEARELLERIFKETIRSGEVADALSNRLAPVPNLGVHRAVPKLEGLVTETPLTFPSSPKSHQLDEHERKTATLVCNAEISNNPQYASSAYSMSSTTTRTQKVSSGMGSVQDIERRKVSKTASGNRLCE
jgi:hypothetical protein